MLFRAGYTLSIPIEIQGVERIYQRESRWRKLLLRAANDRNSGQNGLFWIHFSSEDLGGNPPCQKHNPVNLKD